MIPYVVPFVAYMLASQIAAAFPDDYGWLYPAGVGVCLALTIRLLYGRGLLRPHARVRPGVIVGLVGIAIWIGLCHLEWDPHIAALLPTWLRPPRWPAKSSSSRRISANIICTP